MFSESFPLPVGDKQTNKYVQCTSVYKKLWGLEGGTGDCGWKKGEMIHELNYKDELEFFRLAQGGESIPGMCRGLIKLVVFVELKVGQYD